MSERNSFISRDSMYSSKGDPQFYDAGAKRPDSVATEFVDMDWAEGEEDLSAEFEDTVHSSARNSVDSGSKSMTTVSSYEEITTPRSSQGHEVYEAMQLADMDAMLYYSMGIMPKPARTSPDDQVHRFMPPTPAAVPVEGPRGPHLFRLSSSSFQTDDHVLSLSPITPMVDSASPADRAFSGHAAPTRSPEPRAESVFWPETEFEAGFQSPMEPPSPSPQPKDIRNYFSSAELDPAQLALWTPAMVAQSMLNVGVELSVTEKFLEHHIGGSILGTLKFTDLKELGIHSFGMRTQIWNQIKVLCELKPPSPMTPTPIENAPATVMPQSAGALRRKASTSSVLPPAKPRNNSRRPSRRHGHLRTPVGGRSADDIISPMESVSIVGIEQIIPKPHNCPKGANCSKYRKQQRLIEQFRREHPDADMDGGYSVFITGDPGNPATAPRLELCSPITPSGNIMSPIAGWSRPPSDSLPSVVASSDVLGPGLSPKIQPALQEDVLRSVQKRDPQDNVKQFLDFQHAHMNASNEVPPTPPFELFPAGGPAPMHKNPRITQPDRRLRGLPRLAIPGKPALPQIQQPMGRPNRGSIGRSGLSHVTNAEASPEESAGPSTPPSGASSATSAPPAATGPSHTFVPYSMEKASPLAQELASPSASSNPLRFGTPFSEMDVPVTRTAAGPIPRDISQSVPPEMTLNHSYTNAVPVRSQSRASHRRPSFSVMPAVDELRATPAPAATDSASQTNNTSPTRILRSGNVLPSQQQQSSQLKAPPRVNYPWSPIERRVPFETAIPPRTVTAPQGAVASTTSPSANAPSTSSAQQAASPRASTDSGVAGLAPVTSASSTATTAAAAAGVTYQGPMKKRRTHFLRHEWQDGFFTLKGTRLAMHKDAKTTEKALEYVDIDDYAVACSSLASQSKLSAKFKVASMRRGDKSKDDVANFSFQLVPAEKQAGSNVTSTSPNGLGNATMSSGAGSRLKKRLSGVQNGTASTSTPPPPPGAVNGTGKTHHFAVKNRNQQMTWMRELMLAKAMKQKGEGFEVCVNGNMI
ncbi:hypothetical protein TD95_003486 [Thielaviopsis punctulata]|uniref:SAM domain-containing protein n=1 Tax=Thielaviopsis punctulata TaxID=72032 RepID=A0A0F4ZEY5_9PEZI|nr:hypothetical protein TD95_003486 [Thielaviopsis punctulata]